MPWPGAPGYCETIPDQPGESGYQSSGMYPGTYGPHQDSRYGTSYPTASPMPPSRAITYPESETSAYGLSTEGGGTGTSTPTSTTTLVHRPGPTPGSGPAPTSDGGHGVSAWFHGMPSDSASEDKVALPTTVTRSVPFQAINLPYRRNPSVSSSAYSKDSSSPSSSQQEATPISNHSTPSYVSSPAASYASAASPAMIPPPTSVSRPGDLYVCSTSAADGAGASPATTGCSNDFPPPSTSTYTYRDTSAAAAAIVSRGNPAPGPTHGSLSQAGHTYDVTGDLGEESKPSRSLH